MTDTRPPPPFTERLGNVLRIAGTVATVLAAIHLIEPIADLFSDRSSTRLDVLAERDKRIFDGVQKAIALFVFGGLGSRIANYLLTGRKPWPLNRKTERSQ